MESRPKIFISYAEKDKEIANTILDRLQQAGFEPWNTPIESDSLNSLKSAIRNRIDSSDYIIILISQAALDSAWVQYEMEQAVSKEWSQREIMVLPIKIEQCKLPSYLKKFQWLDLSENLENGLEKIIVQLEMALKIDLRKMNGNYFKNLMVDLLKAYGFKEKKMHLFRDEREYDLIAYFPRKDPFGRIENETWIIEIKGEKYKTELRSLHNFIASLVMFKEPVRGLFITSGQLTSDAKAWLDREIDMRKVAISVLEGTDIKRLLLKKKELLTKYFSGDYNASDC